MRASKLLSTSRLHINVRPFAREFLVNQWLTRMLEVENLSKGAYDANGLKKARGVLAPGAGARSCLLPTTLCLCPLA